MEMFGSHSLRKVTNMSIIGIKNIVLVLCTMCFLFFPNNVMAQEVTVTGVGSDRDAAQKIVDELLADMDNGEMFGKI